MPAPIVVDLDRPAASPVATATWDLDAPASPLDEEPVRPGSRRALSELDAIVANAVSNAIHRALPTDR